MKVKLIAAIDQELGLGVHGVMPWNAPKDLQYFKDTTMGHFVAVGSKTIDSLIAKKRPIPADQSFTPLDQPVLPGRVVIVLSRKDYVRDYLRLGCYVARSLEHALEMARTIQKEWHANASTSARESDIFIAGGGQVYREALEKNVVEEMHLTHIHNTYECDTYFPGWNTSEWDVTPHITGEDFNIDIMNRKVIT
ncbi:Dihydrofolate reductase [compost metagenome]